MPRQQLDDALAQLVNAELIFRRGTPPDAEYTFKHALVQDAAYGTLLRSRRQQIHARIAATLEDQFPEIVVAQPALLARHCAEAGLAEKAVVYWLKAGQQALARSATTEAAAQLRKGLDALDGLPDGPGRRQQELDLQLALGSALIATKGHSAPEVGETFARARALAEQIDRPEYLGRVFFGQWVFHRNRGEYKLALALAEQMEKIGEARNDVSGAIGGSLGKRVYPPLSSGTSLPPVHSWSGVMASLIRRIAAGAGLSADPLRYDARIPRRDLGATWATSIKHGRG